MEHKNNVKINWKTGLTSLVETFWTIGTSIAAAGVLPTHRQAHCLVAPPDTRPKPAKELALPTHGETAMIKHETLTMCIIHKGFRGFRALSHASILGGNLIGLKSAIPYEIIH